MRLSEHKISQSGIINIKSSLRQIQELINRYQETDNLDLIKKAYTKSNEICRILKIIYNSENR